MKCNDYIIVLHLLQVIFCYTEIIGTILSEPHMGGESHHTHVSVNLLVNWVICCQFIIILWWYLHKYLLYFSNASRGLKHKQNPGANQQTQQTDSI